MNVVPDQVVGKGYVEIDIDREKAARYGIQVGDIQDVVEVAMGGRPVTMTVEGRERYPVRVRYARDFRTDEETLKRTLVAPAPACPARLGRHARPIRLGASAVGAGAGPAGGGGRRPDRRGAVDDQERERPACARTCSSTSATATWSASSRRRRRLVAEKVKLPAGMYLEWSGEFEHELRARKTLRVVFPAVIAVIVLILYLTYTAGSTRC